MQGSVFLKFKEFITKKWGEAKWDLILQEAGLSKNTTFLRLRGYSDLDLQKLLLAVGSQMGKTPNGVLEEFGELYGEELMAKHGHVVKPEWNVADTMANAQVQFQEVFKTLTGDELESGEFPRIIKSKRLSDTSCEFYYSSPRKMCGLFVGILRAMAKWHGDEIEMIHNPCMHRGGAHCSIIVNVKQTSKKNK